MVSGRNKIPKNQYRRLYFRVRDIVNRHDPIGLIRDEAPIDEYEMEVSAILPHLRSAQSVLDVQQMVHAIFVEYFGAHTAGPLTAYDEVARKIWEAWQEHRSRVTIG